MTILIAKPVIKNQYWVITDGKKKVGNVIASGSGFDVKVNGNISHFENTKAIRHIEFQNLPRAKTEPENPFNLYPTTGRIHNSILDVKRKLHLFTKTAKSKCFYVAGWFLVNTGSEFSLEFCPKYIFIQRYEYLGPYKTKNEAEAMG